MTAGTLGTTLPLFIAAGGVIIYSVIRLFPTANKRQAGILASLWLGLAFFQLLVAVLQGSPPGQGLYLGLTTGLLITGIGALAVYASNVLTGPDGPVHLYYPLILFALAGAVAVGFSGDLFTIFVAVELSAIPVYALVAFRHREDPAAIPAAMRYLIQGVAGTITALLGVAVLYLAAGTLEIAALPGRLAGADHTVVFVAAVFILLGYGVKLAVVPLHAWLPDAYARAPAAVTAIMVGATKTGVLVALFISLSVLPSGSATVREIGMVIIFLALLTMVAGNLLALNQPDLRYILAYSSVAQMGYILLGFGIGMAYQLELGFTAALYYTIAYSIMKAGSFITAAIFGNETGSYELARMRGIGARFPFLVIAFDIFVLGLSGVPFTCGFLGKLMLVRAGMGTLTMSGVILAIVLALNCFVSLAYYVPVLSIISFAGKENIPSRPGGARGQNVAVSAVFVVVLLAFVTVYLGLFPASFDWIAHASHQLFPWGGGAG